MIYGNMGTTMVTTAAGAIHESSWANSVIDGDCLSSHHGANTNKQARESPHSSYKQKLEQNVPQPSPLSL